MSKIRVERHRVADFVARLPQLHPANVTDVVNLFSIADRLHKYAETACNFSLTDRQEKRVDALEKRAIAHAAALGVTLKFNGDPRGYAVKVMLPNGDYNTWGGKEEGWGI